MSVLLYPSCPTDCSGLLPDAGGSICAPTLGYGEVEWLIVSRADSADFADIESLAEWTTRQAKLNTDPDAISIFHVIGELPEPDVSETTISGDRTVRGEKTFNLNFTIDEDDDDNYEAHLTFECGNKFKIWFATADGMLFGGDSGIEASVLTNYVIPRERTALRVINGKATWKDKRSPLRSVYPLA
jgi:hypothetical protein